MDVMQYPVYRNTSAVRSFTLPPRKGEKKDFVLLPGQTVQAQDDVDVNLLGMYNEIRDVAKEAPAMGGALENLRQEVLAEREISNDLKTKAEKLEKELAEARRENKEMREKQSALDQKIKKQAAGVR